MGLSRGVRWPFGIRSVLGETRPTGMVVTFSPAAIQLLGGRCRVSDFNLALPMLCLFSRQFFVNIKLLEKIKSFFFFFNQSEMLCGA